MFQNRLLSRRLAFEALDNRLLLTTAVGSACAEPVTAGTDASVECQVEFTSDPIPLTTDSIPTEPVVVADSSSVDDGKLGAAAIVEVTLQVIAGESVEGTIEVMLVLPGVSAAGDLAVAPDDPTSDIHQPPKVHVF